MNAPQVRLRGVFLWSSGFAMPTGIDVVKGLQDRQKSEKQKNFFHAVFSRFLFCRLLRKPFPRGENRHAKTAFPCPVFRESDAPFQSGFRPRIRTAMQHPLAQN
ncbi:hypothetical protein E4K72_08445 [Oxalobacteraceae bacterium OM1]|nr:hypothetical protein E4K72_08445 [Oxalobacteraceae bacterium OM1]